MAANSSAGINTIVGSGSKFSGDLSLSGFVRVDGDVDGNLTTEGKVFVGSEARIHGDVTATSAIIGGIVLGNVEAPEFVSLHATAAVIGDITTRHLEVADGVILQGHCIALKDDEQFERTVKERKEAASIRKRAARPSAVQEIQSGP